MLFSRFIYFLPYFLTSSASFLFFFDVFALSMMMVIEVKFLGSKERKMEYHHLATRDLLGDLSFPNQM